MAFVGETSDGDDVCYRLGAASHERSKSLQPQAELGKLGIPVVPLFQN